MPYKRLKNIRVLLVDDDPLILRLISDVLKHLGFSAITKANTGGEAVNLICTHEFDLIITDWRMPDTKGIDLIRFVRSSSKCAYPHVPIILLTGNTGSNYIMKARDAGVTEYMIKPFSVQQLVRRIKSIIENPRSFIDAPHYKGPNRRFHDTELSTDENRRQEAA